MENNHNSSNCHSRVHLGNPILLRHRFWTRRRRRALDAAQPRVDRDLRRLQFCVTLGVGIGIGVFLWLTRQSAAPVFDHYQIVTIQTGDTLWNLCDDLNPPGVDLREAVARCQPPDALIYPGQRVRIPVFVISGGRQK